MAPRGFMQPADEWRTVTHSIGPTSPDFLSNVETFTKDVVLPAIAIVVGTAIGGVGGVLVAAAIVAVQRMAQGQKLGSAIVSSARDNLRDLVAAAKFDETIEVAKKQGLAKMREFGASLKLAAERDAFVQAQGLAVAIVAQEKSIDAFKEGLTPERAAVVDLALASGATTTAIAYGMGGESAAVWMDRAIVTHAGGDPDAGSGTTVGTVATVAGVGVGAAILWALL